VGPDFRADVRAMAKKISRSTIGLVGSAPQYPHGVVDPISELGQLAQENNLPLHVDACVGGWVLPWIERLGRKVPVWDFRVPGVTSISADTHKYGYAFKGSSTLLFRDKALRKAQYFHLLDWSGGKYMSPGMEGSRSGGLIASTWASMVSLGREGYREHAREIFETAAAMMDVVRSHPELRIMGDGTSGAPTFCYSFTSDAFEIYHLVDFLGPKGWRFNGQQYPNAIHMAVTRPQTQPGVADAFATDLADAVQYAYEHKDEKPMSAAIYGGVEGGMTDEADEFIRSVMEDMLDKHQGLPRG
jgi:glutamate/tyrosine decarboxylase-like PLP-dependent enzyme